ncbi:MAG: AAA family ATPase, partial [Ilumatobacteraceae bacterium]
MSTWSSAAAVQWPFVGRDELVALLRSLWSGELSRGVLIHGPAGIGKTRLADEFAASLGTGVEVLRCVGSPATQSTPYAAIAHLIPVDMPPATIDRPRQVLDAVRSQFGGGRRVLVADDIAFVDEASLTLFGHLLALGELFLLGTVRVGHVIPPGLDALTRSYGLHHMTVAALDDAAVIAAASEVVGAPLEPVAAQRLIDSTGGNPLYLRELLLQSVADDAVTILPSGQARIELVASAAPRLVELVGNRLAAVPSALVALLHLVAVAEPLSADDLERAGYTDDAVRLEQQGWIRVDSRGSSTEIRLAHPLHSEVLRSTMGALEYRRQVGRAADIRRARPTPERDDPLRIALWELDAGLEPSAAVLLDGARRARAAVHLSSALRLVEASHRIEPTQAAQHIWLEVLFLMSRFEEAERVGAMPFSGPPDLSLTVSSMMLRMDNLLWGVGDAERAHALVESYRPLFASMGIDFLLAIPEAFIRCVDGQSARAVELLGPVPDDPMMFLLSSLARINAETARGHFAEVERLCQRGLDILQSMPDPRGTMDPIFFRLNRGMARNHSGRSAEVYAEFVVAYGAVVEERQSFVRCFVGMVTGQAALDQGFLESAEQWFAETDVATSQLSLPTARRVALSGRAAAAGMRGDAEA